MLQLSKPGLNFVPNIVTKDVQWSAEEIDWINYWTVFANIRIARNVFGVVCQVQACSFVSFWWEMRHSCSFPFVNEVACRLVWLLSKPGVEFLNEIVELVQTILWYSFIICYENQTPTCFCVIAFIKHLHNGTNILYRTQTFSLYSYCLLPFGYFLHFPTSVLQLKTANLAYFSCQQHIRHSIA